MSSYLDDSLKTYLDKLSGPDPVPGGGSVSAYVASLAMGLTQMVARITLARKPPKSMTPEQEKERSDARETIQEILDSLEKVKKDALEVVDLDPKVYREVMAAWGQDPKTMEDALDNSFRLQADLVLMIIMAAEWNRALAGLVKGSIKNDLLVSAALYESAFRGAWHTAMINVVYMKDQTRKQKAENALEDLKKRFGREAGA